MKNLSQIFCALVLFISCSENTAYKEQLSNPELFQSAVKNLSDIIVYDIFSPPVASRVYMYPTIAAYEIMAQVKPTEYKSLATQLNGLGDAPKMTEKANPELAAIYAYNIIGKTLIFSEDKMEAYQEKLEEKVDDMGVPRSVRKASMAYAQSMADHILQWASKDMYNQTRTYPKYTILEGEKFWKPTPPDYMDGIEPHWNKIRTLVLDSANQFSPKPPLTFDLTKGSPFQTQLQEVYEVGDNLTEEQVEIAKFWDCNPYVTHHRGHAMFATKKITPGGHWIGITAIAARQAKSNFMETVNAFTHVSVALFDAFISCWDEKWNTLVVRPETLINKHYDEEWLPLLQTPPFPEYTSGHSVISRASAVVLTKLYGDNFAFKDTTEVAYGLPVRSFNSFIHASEEAAISRLYGGIHYMMAIEEGVAQGNKVGEHIAKRLQTQIPPTQLALTK
jgi:hypothetical protein